MLSKLTNWDNIESLLMEYMSSFQRYFMVLLKYYNILYIQYWIDTKW